MIVINAEIASTGKMVKTVAKEVNKKVSELVPPFYHEKDVIRLRHYHCGTEGVRVTYEILRSARLRKASEKLSP